MKTRKNLMPIMLYPLSALIAFFCLAIILALTACGGGGGSNASSTASGPVTPASTPAATPPASSPSVTPPSPPKRLVVMLRGDSTNYGSTPGVNNGNVPNQTPANPASLMQADVNLLFGSGVVTIVDRAEPGSTLADDLNGTGPYTDGPLASELAHTTVNVVLTNAELNDATYGVPLGTYVAELDQWVATVRSAGAVPVLMEPNPTCLGTPGKALRALDEPYVQAMHAVGAHLVVTVLTDYDAFLELTPAWQGYLQADCEHPTNAGYEFKEGRYMTALYPVLKALLS